MLGSLRSFRPVARYLSKGYLYDMLAADNSHTERTRHLQDPRELRALAHPARLAIMEQLSAYRELTATQLAELIDESPSNCSWHLRKLAEHGFVEPAGEVPGRRKPWRLTESRITFGDVNAPEVSGTASASLTRMWLERNLDAFLDAQQRVPLELGRSWAEVVTSKQEIVWLTPAQLRELTETIARLVSEYDQPDSGDQDRDADARPCSLAFWGYPRLSMTDAVGERGDEF